jgi:uncharacterized membrane protein
VFRFLIILILVFGIFFRFVNLDRKVYWFDEVYTSFRVAGYTSAEIDREIFQNKIITPPDLQKFQQIKPQSTVLDTLNSLAKEDPQHPPLYFVMARVWMKVFGGFLVASRSLPALLSLLSLPLMYALAMELFASKFTAAIATALLALSPFDILFAQTARQYSLLTAAVIGSSYCLLKAIKNRESPFEDKSGVGSKCIVTMFPRNDRVHLRESGISWFIYSLCCAIGLYTHPFFGLTLVGHGVFVVTYLFLEKNKSSQQLFQQLFNCIAAIAFSLLLYSPWLFVMQSNSKRAFQATSWATRQTDYLYLLKQWILSFSSLFFDLDFTTNELINCLVRLPFILLILVSIYVVATKTNNLTKFFILTFIFVPFLVLAVPDLLLASRRSSVTRYLISCFSGVQLAVAYFLTTALSWYKNQQLWRSLLALLFICSIISCSVSASADTWWSKGVSYFNAEAAKVINKSQSALVISDRGDGSLGKGNLISLSYLLNNNVEILPLSSPVNVEILREFSQKTNSDIFLFKPSDKFWKAFKSTPRKESMPVDRTLWKIEFK